MRFIVHIKKIYFIAINFIIKCFIISINIVIRPLHLYTSKFPFFLQRIEYKLGTHYLRFYGFPRQKPFISGKDEKIIIFFPVIGWYNMVQRPHHLARAFCNAGWTVFYLTHDIEGDKVKGIKQIEKNFYLCSSVRLLRKMENPWIYMYWTVNMYYLNFFKNYKLIYDFIDKIEIQTFYNSKMLKEHKKSLKIAKIVMASSSSLYDEISFLRKDALLIPNAVFENDFIVSDDAQVPIDLIDILNNKKPIIGYYGIFSKWKIDYSLIQFVSNSLPDVNIVLIGPDYDQSVNDFKWDLFPNIYFFDKKNYQELPFYARFFDVAILPFLVNEITNAISPVKLFEYLAMNLPVVSTNIAECRKYKSVLIADSSEEFIKKIDFALNLNNNVEFQKIVKEEISVNNWDYHCQKIIKKIEDLTNM